MIMTKIHSEAPQSKGTSYVRSPLTLFRGMKKTSDICLRYCLNQDQDQECSFYGIQLSMSEGCDTVQDAIDRYLLPDQRMKCPNCNCNDFLRSVTLTELPTMLLLGLPRDASLTIPIELRVGDVTYTFHSAVLREGLHNIALCKVSTALIEINDTQVRKIGFGMLQNKNYSSAVSLIVYHKQTPSTPAKCNIKPRVSSTSKKWQVGSMTGEQPDNSQTPAKENENREPGTGPQVQHAITFANGVKTVHIRCIISYELFYENMKDEEFKFFTGLSKCNFNALFELNGGDEGILNLKYSYQRRTPKRKKKTTTATTAVPTPLTKEVKPPTKISAKSRLLLLLMRMRRGLPVVDLGYAFGIGKTYAASIFFTVLRKVCNTFRSMEKLLFLTREQQQKKRPAPFRKFPAVRVIIDGVEFKTYTPSNYEQQGNTWSSYKKANTVKYLIGISCYGAVVFVSEGFEGSKSDKEIFNACGLGSWLEKGDAVMCDRGFDIVGELLDIGVTTLKPPYLGSRTCLTPAEQAFSSAVAQARIYVEHAIGKIKEFRLLRFTIPLNMIGTFNDLVYVAGYLTNFSNRAIKQRPTKKNTNRN